MGQKVNPIGLRLGIIRGWESNWYGGKEFADKLIEDEKIRQYIMNRAVRSFKKGDAKTLGKSGAISKIVIERTLKRITLTLHTARPGVVIGQKGGEVDMIREELKKVTGKDIQINIYEIKRPEVDAKLVGEAVAQQLEARISYRRAMKQAISSAVRVGAQGIKIRVSGRLGGAEMARTEEYKEGRVPLHTLRADIDYAISEALTVYGKIGIKVWVFKGEVFGKRDLSPITSASPAERGSNDRGGDRGGDRRRDGGGERGGDRGGDRRQNNRGGNASGPNNRGGSGNTGPNNRGGGANAGGGRRK
jgi:small subunit ribosomal protein S3